MNKPIGRPIDKELKMKVKYKNIHNKIIESDVNYSEMAIIKGKWEYKDKLRDYYEFLRDNGKLTISNDILDDDSGEPYDSEKVRLSTMKEHLDIFNSIIIKHDSQISLCSNEETRYPDHYKAMSMVLNFVISYPNRYMSIIEDFLKSSLFSQFMKSRTNVSADALLLVLFEIEPENGIMEDIEMDWVLECRVGKIKSGKMQIPKRKKRKADPIIKSKDSIKEYLDKYLWVEGSPHKEIQDLIIKVQWEAQAFVEEIFGLDVRIKDLRKFLLDYSYLGIKERNEYEIASHYNNILRKTKMLYKKIEDV